MFADVLQNRCSYKFRKFHRKTPLIGSLFNTVAGLDAFNFIKKRLHYRFFPVKSTKFLETPFFTEHLQGGTSLGKKKFIFSVHIKGPYSKLLSGKMRTRIIPNTDPFFAVICTSNHMFGRAIWDKFPKVTRMVYPKNRSNQTCHCWLITPNRQTLCIETNMF